MKRERTNIVFFTPTMNRTGSELVLLNLLPFASEFNVTVITKYKGELYDSLPASVSKKYLYKSQSDAVLNRLINRFRRGCIVPAILKAHKKATWYVNTIVLPDILECAQMHKIKTVVHVHELEQMYKLLSKEQLKRLINYPFLIIANSHTSAAVLDSLGRKEKMKVIYPAIETKKIRYDEPTALAYRKKLGINVSTFVWAMCGTVDNNKNPDLFKRIAAEFEKEGADVKMIWIGGTKQQDTKVITWLGDVKEEFHNYFSVADGFVLTSERESFSMVTVEAILLGLPVVANNCGGVSEILGKNSDSIITERNNADQMLEKMRKIMKEGKKDNSELKGKMKAFDAWVIGKQWIELLKERIKP